MKLTPAEVHALRHHRLVTHGEFLDARSAVLSHRLQTNNCQACAGGLSGAPERSLEPPLTRLVRDLERAETEVTRSRITSAEATAEKRRLLSVIRKMLAMVRAELSTENKYRNTSRGGNAATGMEM